MCISCHRRWQQDIFCHCTAAACRVSGVLLKSGCCVVLIGSSSEFSVTLLIDSHGFGCHCLYSEFPVQCVFPLLDLVFFLIKINHMWPFLTYKIIVIHIWNMPNDQLLLYLRMCLIAGLNHQCEPHARPFKWCHSLLKLALFFSFKKNFLFHQQQQPTQMQAEMHQKELFNLKKRKKEKKWANKQKQLDD